MIAPRAEVFAVGAVDVALQGHVVDCQARREGEVAAGQFGQVLQIREHGMDYIIPESRIAHLKRNSLAPYARTGV